MRAAFSAADSRLPYSQCTASLFASSGMDSRARLLEALEDRLSKARKLKDLPPMDDSLPSDSYWGEPDGLDRPERPERPRLQHAPMHLHEYLFFRIRFSQTDSSSSGTKSAANPMPRMIRYCG